MEPAAKNPTPSAAGATPGRVLLVDDQDELRELFRRTLRKDGHEVVTAANGREAVVLARETRFDVVVSNVRMPDMTGVELLQELHERDPDLPVLSVAEPGSRLGHPLRWVLSNSFAFGGANATLVLGRE